MRHKENKATIKEAKRGGFDLDNGHKRVAFIVDSMLNDQNTYNIIIETNKFLADNFGTDVSIFYVNNAPSFMVPLFAIYSCRDIRGYQGSLIATSLETAEKLKNANTAKRYYFVNDLKDLNDRPDAVENLKKNNVLFITPNEEYSRYLEKAFGVKTEFCTNSNFIDVKFIAEKV